MSDSNLLLFPCYYNEPEEYDLNNLDQSNTLTGRPGPSNTTLAPSSAHFPQPIIFHPRFLPKHGGRYHQVSSVDNDEDSEYETDDENTVPPSLMIEMNMDEKGKNVEHTKRSSGVSGLRQELGVSGANARNQNYENRNKRPTMKSGLTLKEKTMWKWTNVENLDKFSTRVSFAFFVIFSVGMLMYVIFPIIIF